MKAPDEWVDLYRSKFGIYENFTNKLEDLIKDLLHAIDIVQINYRPKTIESFADKINREGKDYLDPIQEITDLVGIRIICYYLEDVNVVSEILKREFKIDLENSIDKSQILDPDKFGYLSVHYIITLADNRKDLTEWKDYSEIKAQIQLEPHYNMLGLLLIIS